MRFASTIACLAAVALAAVGVSAQDAKKEKAPVIILKLDDMSANGAPSKGPNAVSSRWQRVIDFIRNKNLKATIGVQGFSLDGDNRNYFDYLKRLDKEGFELWNHGYRSRTKDDPKGEFETDSVEEQKAALEKTQNLMKEKTGIELKAFGPHWSGTNEATFRALEQIPEIKMVFFYSPPSRNTTKFIFERSVNLENPTFVPDFEKFKAAYEQLGRQRDYIAMQGHPNQWSDERWSGFEKIISYLMEDGCVFMTASEYLGALNR